MANRYDERFQQLKSYMESQDMGLLMITSPINIYYFTGFFSDPHERFMALFYSKEGEASLFVPSLDEESAQQHAVVSAIIPISDTDNPYEFVKKKWSASVTSLGIEKKIMNVYQSERIKECFPQAEFADIEEFIMSLRLKKDSEDILIVKRAIEIAEKVIALGVSKVTPGVTELELTAELEYQMKVLGADRPSFSTIVLSGKRSALPHGRPENQKIETGGYLLLDLGVFVEGFCSDITRTFLVGEGSDEQKKIYETVRMANEKAIKAVKAGKPIGVVDQAARDYIESQGYGKYFMHRVGHGLGLEIHEAPSIHSQNETRMETGMLFTIEPGIYISDIGGVRIEDDVYIRPDGEVEVLTSYPKQLIQL